LRGTGVAGQSGDYRPLRPNLAYAPTFEQTRQLDAGPSGFRH
jgi:hypothetical protein